MGCCNICKREINISKGYYNTPDGRVCRMCFEFSRANIFGYVSLDTFLHYLNYLEKTEKKGENNE